MARHKVQTLGLARSADKSLVAVHYGAELAALASELADELSSDVWVFDFFAVPWAHPVLRDVDWIGVPPRKACPLRARCGDLLLTSLPHFYETAEPIPSTNSRMCYFATYPIGGFLL